MPSQPTLSLLVHEYRFSSSSTFSPRHSLSPSPSPPLSSLLAFPPFTSSVAPSFYPFFRFALTPAFFFFHIPLYRYQLRSLPPSPSIPPPLTFLQHLPGQTNCHSRLVEVWQRTRTSWGVWQREQGFWWWEGELVRVLVEVGWFW